MSAQFVYMFLTMVPSLLVFDQYQAGCAWLIFNLLIGTWNGAAYYIDVFSKRYNLKFTEEPECVGGGFIPLDELPPLLDPSKRSDASCSSSSSSVASQSDSSSAVSSADSDDLKLDESQATQLAKFLQNLENVKKV